MGWGNIYRRRLKVFSVALVIYLDYKALQQRDKWVRQSKKATLWERAHQRNAKRVLTLILELEGLWVKLGQYLSTRADVLPEAYICVLKQLQDSLPPRPLQEDDVSLTCQTTCDMLDERYGFICLSNVMNALLAMKVGKNHALLTMKVCKTIQKELGKAMGDLFLDFVKDPLATASIAQVHRATLINGQDVVVKVQHEGIKRIILEDLKNAKSLVDWIAWAEPQYDFNTVIDEWCREAPKELDFNHEAENTRTVSRNLGCHNKYDVPKPNNHVDVVIPEVIQSTEKVLILEYMDGIRLNDVEALEACGVNKQKLVEEITRAYAHQIYVDGFFNGDPHPGNFLVSKMPPHCPILLDFGLTKVISSSMKQALAKMFLASAEGDHVALLSAFAEMGLKLRLDVPEQAMEVTSIFFRTTTPANEALENIKSLAEQRTKNMKIIQEKMNLSQKEVKRFNPVDAFPGDIVIFSRVLNLLRGLSTLMNVRIIYFDIMRPFAESVLQGSISKGPAVNANWIYDTPASSNLEAKLRQLLVQLGMEDKILGIQVCAYKDGETIIDTAAGVLGRYDPRPVQPDSLFPVFSVTKGITAGMVHWLVDNGKLKFDENVAGIWPEFGSNKKDIIKVHHVLNHTSGLHNALAAITKENPLLMTNWDECLRQIALSAPETEPGFVQLYHYLAFGWLCGGIVEHSSGKKFQEILEEAFIGPLKINGELYIGIPPGMFLCVESRLANLTLDTNDLENLSKIGSHPELPSSFQPQDILQLVATLPAAFNSLNVRRAIIPAANGHCSARALARYYAALADGGLVPPAHSSSNPPLGSHAHIPKFSLKPSVKPKDGKRVLTAASTSRANHLQQKQQLTEFKDGFHSMEPSMNGATHDSVGGKAVPIIATNSSKLFKNPRIHDAFLGVGEYENLVFSNGNFGLGFRRFYLNDGSLAFGHSGMGGSMGYCDPKNRFSVAVTLNKMSLGAVTATVVKFICSELNLPYPEEFSRFSGRESDSILPSNLAKPLIN
ncbi:ABC1 atypical kinase-like domain [Dillenia turbinata]|uniref:ABC1 atypical kinase-like domain n=1 Tax=Dillenia turbinata TaxID=194707 RepID=A0AAN8UBE1_9MAGN